MLQNADMSQRDQSLNIDEICSQKKCHFPLNQGNSTIDRKFLTQNYGRPELPVNKNYLEYIVPGKELQLLRLIQESTL